MDIVKREINQSVETHVADLSKELHFIKDQTVDVIVSSLVLHYIEDWCTPLREFNRILKPGGICLLSVHHPLFDMRFNKERYFEKRLVSDTWLGFGKNPLHVQYYVRPLKEYLMPLSEPAWKSVNLEEPLPSPDLKKRILNFLKNSQIQPSSYFTE
jgi:SAM-dependent methyltransferase